MTRPKPIPTGPHAGHLQVVLSFRVAEPLDPQRAQRSLARTLPHVWGWEMHDLAVAVRVIGAAGERSETEGGGP